MRSLPRLPEETRAAFLAACRSHVGKTRFRRQGRNERGVDCIGLIAVSLRECGIDWGDVRDYADTPDPARLRAGLVERFGEPVLAWRPGDVVLLRWATRNGPECHAGVLGMHGDRWTLIHAYLQERRVVEHGLAGDWMKRVSDVFSLTGVD